MVGNTLSHYKLTDKLGEGGMGVVYKAEDLILKRIVAVKVFPSAFSASSEDRARFFQEAHLASGLNHPNIVTIHEFDEFEGSAFIVSECIDGITLNALLQRGPLVMDQILDIAIQISSGIAAAHSQGIIHRDIKPDNVMVTNQGQVKVMDFGLARLMGSSHVTSPGSLIGTFAYMSPEQINEEEVDVRSDIFSFGTLLYQLVTGQLPFRGKTIAELLAAITRKHPEGIRSCRPEVSPELERIIAKALKKDPAQRYQAMETLKTDLERLRKNPAMKPRREGYDIVRPYLMTGIILAVLGGSIAGYRLWNKQYIKNILPEQKSIAVLPFANEGNNDSTNFFSVGFADDIITRLSFIRSLMVVPTSAIIPYQGKIIDVRKAGKDLSADYVLEGRFRKGSDRFFITAQLVDVPSGKILWGDNINFPWKESHVIQENVAYQIVEALRLKLTEREYGEVYKVRTANAEAYEYYLRGITFTINDSREHNELAMKMLERAITLDDHFAEACAALSNVYIEQFWSNYSPDKEWVDKGKIMASKALALDSNLAVAHASLGFANRVQGNYKESLLEAARALVIDPHTSFSLEEMSEFYRNKGDFDKGLLYAQKALAVDPSFNICRVRARIFQFQGNYRESITELEKAIKLSPEDSWLRGALLAMSLIHLGELDRAEREISIAESIDPDKPETHLTKAMLHTVRGNYLLADRELDSIRTFLDRDYALSYCAASIYARQNKPALALQALQTSIQLGNRWYSWCHDAWFDNIRNDPKFIRMMEHLKNELEGVDNELRLSNYHP